MDHCSCSDISTAPTSNDMVRFSLGDDDSSGDDASEPQGSPLVSPETMVLRDSNARRFPRTPSPRRATPGAKAAGEDRRRSSDLERARRAAVDADADAAVAGLRARIRDLSTADAAPPGKTARAFQEADAAARRLRADAALKHDAEHARLVAAAEKRHAAARRRIEALAAEEARRSAEKSRRAARDAFRRAFDDAASWDDLDALSALADGVADGAEAAALRAAEAAAARIQTHLEAARVAAAVPALAAAAEGLDACLRELDAGGAGGLTRTSEAGKMAALAVGVCRKALAQAKRAPPKPVAPPAPAPAPAAPAAAAPPAAAPADAGGEARATAALAAAEAAAKKLEADAPLKPLCRALKKVVGAAVNSVGNDCASALKCAETLAAALADPLGRGQQAPAPFFGGGANAAKRPLHDQFGALLAQRGVDDAACGAYVAYVASQKLGEKLLGETFNRRTDVWALAAVLNELVARAGGRAPSLRPLLQGALLARSPAAAAKPGDNVADASKVAALVAALAVVDAPAARAGGHPFGGLPAAWGWLARYVNGVYGGPVANQTRSQAKKAALPALVAFLETAAFFLLEAYGAPFLRLLELAAPAVAAAPKDADGENQLAAANFADLAGKARARRLERPAGFATFTAA